MELNYWAIIIATILQFIFGAIWYGPIFDQLWGRIHGFDKLSKEVQQAMMKKMAPLYVTQLVVTLMTSLVFAIISSGLPAEWNLFGLAMLAWIGLVVPTQVSAVIFGGTEPKWVVKKIAVAAMAALGCLEILAACLYFIN